MRTIEQESLLTRKPASPYLARLEVREAAYRYLGSAEIQNVRQRVQGIEIEVINAMPC